MIQIRAATITDATLLRTMIRELAEFERELEMVTILEEDLARDGFGANPRFRPLIAEWDGESAGYALFFPTFSTWVGRGLFLEDLFVRERFRGKGIGRTLLTRVAQIAVDEKCVGMRWEVLNWNEPAIELYKALGAEFQDRWCPVLLTGQPLLELAGKSSEVLK